MNKIIVGLLFLSISQTVFAKTVKCQVSEPVAGGAKMSVPVNVTSGNMIPSDDNINFKEKVFSVTWNAGGEYESQTYLQMQFGESVSTMYDINLQKQVGPINVIEFDGLRFQCWAE